MELFWTFVEEDEICVEFKDSSDPSMPIGLCIPFRELIPNKQVE